MAGPFHNAVKGTTAGAPGAGAFTPNAASIGARAWSLVPSGWWGMVRFEEGAAWELSYCYWNGATISRAMTQFVASSTGAILTLTAVATAAMIPDGNRIAPHPVLQVRQLVPLPGLATTPTAIGLAAATVTGTAAAGAIAATNYLTEQPRVHTASVTTANAQAGFSHATGQVIASSTAGRAGWEFACRFGATTLPAGPKLMVGMLATTFVAVTTEPSAQGFALAAFAKDSTDANIQLMTASPAPTKFDTGIPLVANGWYECVIWSDPGSLTIKALLVRADTGAIWYKETALAPPAAGTILFPQCIGGLSATIGTAFTLAFGGYTVRNGGW